MATVPERRRHCEYVVEAILPQVDRLNVALNGHDDIPGFLRHEKVNAVLMDNSLTDAAKFSWSDAEGYHVILDDDIIYAPNFVQEMIAHVERYERRAVIALGGKRFDWKPVGSYYRGWSMNLKIFLGLTHDTRVHVPITAALAFHSDTIRFTAADLRILGNADISLGLLLNERGIPCYAAAHEGDLVTPQRLRNKPTIFLKYKDSDRGFADAVGEVTWQG